MEPELREHLLSLARIFATARKIETVTVARLAAGDWRFFSRLEEGTAFTVRKYDTVVAWFSANWPEDAEWPTDVSRPAAQDVAA